MFTILSHWPWEKSVMLTKDWGFQETNENQETKKNTKRNDTQVCYLLYKKKNNSSGVVWSAVKDCFELFLQSIFFLKIRIAYYTHTRVVRDQVRLETD